MSREIRLFEEAIMLRDESARVQFLREACAEDQPLFLRLQRLLIIHEQESDFLARPAMLDVLNRIESNLQSHQPGDTIGPYQLIEVLGQGGMAVVWRARQMEPVCRDVAIKFRARLSEPSHLVKRVQREIRALAMMHHANVATILDVSQTELGELFLVMELVNGIPITEFCSKYSLPLEARIKLVLEICNGVQHAHQRGIIHRDLKPANLLTFEQDGAAHVKVIDFGIAKLLDSENLSDQTTLAGQIFGTPEYMSPEQAQFTPHSVDIRSDIYSIGVVLYELLTDELPYEGFRQSQSLAELFRVLREEEPVPPEKRGPAKSLHLSRLPVDLNWIIMRSLEREPDERYASVDRLADDLKNFLAGRPVSAGPPTAAYRLTRWLRRNRATASMLTTIGAVLIIATIISIMFAVGAGKSKRLAIEAAVDAEKARSLAQARLELAEIERARAEGALDQEAHQREETEFRAYVAHVAAAQAAIGLHDTFEAVTNLSDAPENYRAFEWWYLLGQVDQSERSFGGSRDFVQYGHQGRVVSSIFHPTQDWLFTGGQDGAIILWELSTGKELGRYDGGAPVSVLRIAPHGRWIVAGSKDGRLICLELHGLHDTDSYSDSFEWRLMWDRSTGTGTLRAIDWLPDGSEVLVVVDDGQRGNLSRIRVANNELVEVIASYDDPITAFAMRPDGAVAIAVNHRVLFWPPGLDGEPQTVIHKVHDQIDCLAFHPDNGLFCINARFGIELYDIESGAPIDVLTGHTGPIHDVQFSPDGGHLASVSEDGTLRIWDTTSRQPVAVKCGHVREITDLEFSPDSSMIATAGRLCAKLWRPKSSASPATNATTIMNGVLEVKAAANTDRILVSTLGGPLVCDLSDGELFDLSGVEPISTIRELTYSADGAYVAWCDMLGQPHLLSVDSNAQLPIPAVEAAVTSLALDGEFLYTADQLGAIRRYAVNSDQSELCCQTSGLLHQLVISVNGKTLAWHDDRSVVVMDVATRQELCRHENRENQVLGLAISDAGDCLTVSNGQSLGYQGYDYLSFWSVADGWIDRLPAEHSREIESAAWSRDGRRFATASRDGTVKIWDRQRLQVVLTLRSTVGGCKSLSFSNQDQMLIGVSSEGHITLWETLPQNRRKGRSR